MKRVHKNLMRSIAVAMGLVPLAFGLVQCKPRNAGSGVKEVDGGDASAAYLQSCKQKQGWASNATNTTENIALTGEADGGADEGAIAQNNFKQYCTSCHGPEVKQGTNVGDLSQYGSARGAADRIRDMLSTKKMPPATVTEKDKLLPDDVRAALIAWTKTTPAFPGAGAEPAPDTTQINNVGNNEYDTSLNFISMKDQAECIRLDYNNRLAQDRPYLRYFTMSNMYNGGLQKDMPIQRIAFFKALNSLSRRNPKIQNPFEVDLGYKTIFRVDIRAYSWTSALQTSSFAQLTKDYLDKYGKVFKGNFKQGEENLIPMRIDWFMKNAMKAPAYYSLLDFNTTSVTLFGFLQTILGSNPVDVFNNSEFRRVAFDQSAPEVKDISPTKGARRRVVDNFRGNYVAYDFQNVGETLSNPVEYPFGPCFDVTERTTVNPPFFACSSLSRATFISHGVFQANNAEVLFKLPNRLHGYASFAAAADNQKYVMSPANKVFVDGSNAALTNLVGSSCMGCHRDGTWPVTDNVNARIVQDAKGKVFYQNKEVSERIGTIYRGTEDAMNDYVASDRSEYKDAIKNVGQTDTSIEPVKFSIDQFDSAVNSAKAAAELGMPQPDFMKHLAQSPEARKLIGDLMRFDGTVNREQFDEKFSVLADLLGGDLPLDCSTPGVPNLMCEAKNNYYRPKNPQSNTVYGLNLLSQQDCQCSIAATTGFLVCSQLDNKAFNLFRLDNRQVVQLGEDPLNIPSRDTCFAAANSSTETGVCVEVSTGKFTFINFKQKNASKAGMTKDDCLTQLKAPADAVTQPVTSDNGIESGEYRSTQYKFTVTVVSGKLNISWGGKVRASLPCDKSYSNCSDNEWKVRSAGANSIWISEAPFVALRNQKYSK